MNNYKVLFSLRTLKNILTNFVDSFLVLYFLDISDRNIIPLGIYKLVAIIAIYSVIFVTRNFSKSKNRANLMRIGIVLDFVYFLTIILLRDKIVDYIYLVGLLYGLEEGFYYSVYNILESDGITNEERAKFAGTCTAIESILSIIFPLIFGSLIYATGFLKSL
ncbi:MAG: MFS transporter, partial [Clostridia bacterium]|nr:MFS transporter [Clostridia bacterium]